MTLASRNIPSRPSTSEDWIDFSHDGIHYTVNLSFMVSNYECIYGRGTCAIRQGVQDTEYRTDIGGCCFLGVDLDSDEVEKMEERIARLTPEIVNQATYERIQATGGGLKWNTDKEGNRVNVHTRVFDGGCIFANRANEGDKRGCSFHHLAEAEGAEHVDRMPFVCWAYPISVSKFYGDEHPYPEYEHRVVSNMVYEAWGFGGTEKGEVDDIVQAICTEIPDTYVGMRPVYLSYEREIGARIGADAYARMVQEIEKRIATNRIEPTRGEVRNGGRPLLPLIIGNRRDKYKF